MQAKQLAIIGAGPGGLAALEEALLHGISVVLFDENRLPGGQYFRQIPSAFRNIGPSGDSHAGSAKADSFIRLTAHPSVHYMPDTVVWGFFKDNEIAYANRVDQGLIRADNVIVATGAIDRPVPFPGWTLPGVLTAGGAQNLLMSQRVLPGRRVLISGNGPLNFAVAYNLLKAGAELVEILEVSEPHVIWHELPALLSNLPVLCKGLVYRANLLTARVPLRKNRIVVEARGDTRVQEVITAPIDSSGRVDYSRSEGIKLDTLVVGFGLVPSTEMTRTLGCDHRYDPRHSCFIPVRSDDLETTVPGIFAVGDCTGSKGGEIALIEGRLAALSVATRLGCITKDAASRIRSPLAARLRKLNLFHSAMENLFRPPSGFLGLLKDDTIICRCEEVTAGELKEALRKGILDMNTLKSLTRVSMGRCQGRNCLGTFGAIVAEEWSCAPSDLVFPRIRQPLKPIRLGDLSIGELPSPTAPEMKLA